MADALSELSMPPPIDPEAQAAVTDFLDYTEFFPSDLFRSLSLIGKLDDTYKQDAAQVHQLSKAYSTLSSLPSTDRPSAQALRKDISTSLEHALKCREASLAEATRLCSVADNLYNRLVAIKAKLVSMPTPPSRDPTPPPPQNRTPQTNRTRRNEGERTPRLKLFVDTDKANTTARNPAAGSRQKNRVRRIIVPGEVMPPFDPNSPGASIDSDSDLDVGSSPARRPFSGRSDSAPGEKIGYVKTPKLKLGPKLPKTPRIRAPGVMGTNVHSSVAGISVSNAMASLTPPPQDPEPGSEWAPWLELTEWELNHIRKKMKKNAHWQPSDIMKKRELELRGRGPVNKQEAKAIADAEGIALLDEAVHQPSGRAQQMVAEAMTTGKRPKLPFDLLASDNLNTTPAISTAGGVFDDDGDRKVDDKERRRLQEQQEMAEMSSLISQYSATVEKILGQPMINSPPNGGAKSTPPQGAGKRSHKKRKRERETDTDAPADSYASPSLIPPSTAEGDDEDQEWLDAQESHHASEDERIDPLLLDSTSPAGGDSDGPTAMAIDPALMGETISDGGKDETQDADEETGPPSKKIKLVAQAAPPRKKKGTTAKVPLAPPGSPGPDAPTEETSNAASSAARSTRPRRAAAAPEPPRAPASKPKANAAAPASKGGTISLRLATPNGKDAAQTATAPAEEPPPSQRVSARKPGGPSAALDPPTSAKRTGSQDAGDAARDAGAGADAPRARRPSRTPKQKTEPHAGEERFCLCGDVSYGEMVACENGACGIEWFHLACVGLARRPSVREMWFCPVCREQQGIDVHGNKVAEDVAASVTAAAAAVGADEGKTSVKEGRASKK